MVENPIGFKHAHNHRAEADTKHVNRSAVC